ncbi:MAG: ATP-dependent RecD-like DNA helicase, partial [Planctomycetota bacterium]
LASDEISTLYGKVEKIIFEASDTEYKVLRFFCEEQEKTINIVGYFASLHEGEYLEIQGKWVNHNRYGKQFKVEFYKKVSPQTLKGMADYIGSGLVPGIGKKMAKRIVDRFGLQALEIIEKEPNRLKEIPGIGKTRANQLAQEIQKRLGDHEINVFLHTYGIGGMTKQKILDRFGKDTKKVLEENPYALTDIQGIGFIKADQIARKMGLPEDSPYRGKAALHHILQQALEKGSTCLPLEILLQESHKLTKISPSLLEEWLQEEVDQEKIRFHESMFFLPYVYRMEMGAVQRILNLLDHPIPSKRRSFPLDPSLSEEQKQAVQMAQKEKIMILTGGPGVGKTYTVMGIAKMLQAQKFKIALCAPTGRAAKRIQESTSMEAKTIHRLLRYQPKHGFYHNRNNPLDIDALVVDESSMVDILLFYHLLEALPLHSRLLLVGDKDQLPPVGPGNPFSYLIQSGLVPTVHLTKIFRQQKGSLIIQNAHKIRLGEPPIWNNKPPGDFYFFEQSESSGILERIEQLLLEKIPHHFGIPTSKIQILTPMRRGLLGYENLNNHLQQILNPHGEAIAKIGPYHLRKGDRVMQIRNNYDKEIFNGDMGILEGRKGEEVIVNFGDSRVALKFDEVRDLVLAYAISIHKSQGSEYPCII